MLKNKLDEIGTQQLELETFHALFYGLKNDQVILPRIVKLPVMIGISPCVKTQMVNFLVIDYPIPCKVLIERPFFKGAQIVKSIH